MKGLMLLVGIAVALILFCFYLSNKHQRDRRISIPVSASSEISTQLTNRDQWKVVAVRSIIKTLRINAQSEYVEAKWGRRTSHYDIDGYALVTTVTLITFENIDTNQRLVRQLADDTAFIVGDLCRRDSRGAFFRI